MSEPLMTADLVRLDVEPAGDKSAVIGQMADLIAATGRSDRDGLEAGLLAREESFATGMPGGFAIPHCRTEAVHEAALGLLRLSEPVDFGSADGPADLVIGISAPAGTDDQHLRLLAQLSRALVRPEFLASLRAATTPQEVADLVMGVIEPEPEAEPEPAQSSSAADVSPAPAPTDSTAADAPTDGASEDAPASAEDSPVLLAITSCPTGIAHTYMAAESLETAAAEKGVRLHVETQGSGGITPFTSEQIAEASVLIVAADVNISGRERFAGMPVIEHPVKRAISDGPEMVDEAVAAARDPRARKVSAEAGAEGAGTEGSGGSGSTGTSSAAAVSWPKRIQAAVMTGVSYMIPFVAAGGLLMALGFLLGGFDVSYVAQDVATGNSLTNLPGHLSYDGASGQETTSRAGLLLYLGAVAFAIGSAGMGFLVAALSGFIAFGLAGRPGIAPGFIGGAISVTVGAGFLGGLVTGLLAGLIAMGLASLRPPRWLAGLMPVVIIPLVTSGIVAGAMLLVLGRPLAWVMEALQNALTGMSGTSAILLGVILGLMMCVDLGGPINKAAYLFATAGLSQGTEASFHIMAAVMAAGMVPPLAMALSTAVRRSLYTQVERENGTTAWLLGASFISEGAIPFAAADPLRVIPSMMAGGAVTGALSMAFGVGSQAPHGGIFVFFAISPVWGYVLAIVIGTLLAAALVTVLKEQHARRVRREAATA
ncbi:PTS fructose transporter subunit IIABC [Brachybacterium kimchii]|uniref:Fructose-specific PTS transporter subunit EIIC n=1 Tax=Brachybacterium kimchii TaxID=2942909 RepID=A0ABY4N782_9MICO|nr:fructose-specific PTS transporter subunit EIIC [Brachybacterium kimchii]UQN29941.1 fructose-specific PTS transporter subunit EIIC [Brachybacterium kimchii]